MASNYLAYKLTGAYVLDHVSASYSEPLYDVGKGTWATEWCEDLAPGMKRCPNWSGPRRWSEP